MYKLTMKVEEVYKLGPKVRVLTVLSEDSAILAVKKEYQELVQRRIHENGEI